MCGLITSPTNSQEKELRGNYNPSARTFMIYFEIPQRCLVVLKLRQRTSFDARVVRRPKHKDAPNSANVDLLERVGSTDARKAIASVAAEGEGKLTCLAAYSWLLAEIVAKAVLQVEMVIKHLNQLWDTGENVTMPNTKQ